jgi:hypothetical protein
VALCCAVDQLREKAAVRPRGLPDGLHGRRPVVAKLVVEPFGIAVRVRACDRRADGNALLLAEEIVELPCAPFGKRRELRGRKRHGRAATVIRRRRTIAFLRGDQRTEQDG